MIINHENTQVVHQQQMMFNINVSTRMKLEAAARENGVTMSWIIRSLLSTYIRRYKIPPVVKRPLKFNKQTIKFNVCFYNNKNDIQNWVKSGGQEFGPVIRHILILWEEGLFKVDLDNLFTIKEHHFFRKIGEKGIWIWISISIPSSSF